MTTLLYSGNLGLGQDVGTVLHAAASLQGNGDLRILIVGSGKGLPAVKRLSSELQLHNAEFREPVPLDQLSALLADGDVHLICQKPGTEGLLVPSKFYGTLAVGRPALFIGPERCEVAQIIDDCRCGYVVEPGDVAAAAHALATLTRSAALRWEMGENAKEYYAYYFGRKRSVTRIVDVIERVGEHTVNRPHSLIGR